MIDRHRSALVEELSLTAWPALKTVHRDGWLIRVSGGHTGRANSVNLLAPGREPNAEKIAYAEAIYRAHGLPPMFRLTPLAPHALERDLRAAGYKEHDTSSVQVLDAMPDGGAPANAEVRIQDRPTDGFCDAFAQIRDLPAAERLPMRGILEAVAMPSAFVVLTEDGRAAATAMAVVDRGWAGLFKVAVDPALQGRGLGRRATLAALSAARALGAHRAYLQVGATNGPALSLYAGLGFRELHTYTYMRL